MNRINKLLAFCVLLFSANVMFVAAQETAGDKPKDKIENGKGGTEAPVSNAALKTDSNSTDSINPYKNQASEKYRIGFQDTIQVDVFRHPELQVVQNVSPDGTIMLPRIDRPVIAVCKTERELSETITAYYKSYLKNPFVTARAVEQRSQSFSVIGAVKKPGSFYLNKKVTLLELLAFAGGHDVEVAGSKIQIARTGNINGCAETSEEENAEDNFEFISYKINDVLQGKENPLMQPGDIVSILIAEEAYVIGNVLKPTKVTLNEPKTLTQALALAGGTDSTANTGKVIIQRQEPGGVKKELVFNLKDIREQKVPDPQLQANDIVQVSNDKIKSVTKGIRELFKSTIPGVIRPY